MTAIGMARADIRRFQWEAGEAAEFLRSHLKDGSRFKIVSHLDPDGIAATGLLARCLCTYDVPFHVAFTDPMGPKELAELGKEDYDIFVFLDQGSAQLPSIHKFILGKGRSALILDHHPGEFMEHPRLALLNPNLSGLSGSRDVSAAGIVFSVLDHLDKGFRPWMWLSLVGSISDRQEFPSGFVGVNEVLLKQMVDLGFVGAVEGLRLIGRSLIPVSDCLRLSTRPYLPGLSGKPSECLSLIDALGIPPSGKIDDLGWEAEVRLRDALLARVGPVAEDEDFRRTLWGPVYQLATGDAGPKSVGEYVAVFNACKNSQRPELGLAAALGDGGPWPELTTLLRDYQAEMLGALEWLAANLDSFKVTPKMRCIYAGSAIGPKAIGEVLSLAIESGLIVADRPIVGIVDAGGGELKISGRATWALVAKGAHIGRALARAAAAVGGHGGGHDVAGAARAPRERLSEFAAELERALETP